jgi:GT2 family glycosyltransferase
MATGLIVAIPTMGRPDLLRRTLASLDTCRKPGNFRGIIVVENGPKGGAEAVVAACDPGLKLQYFYLPTAGQSRAKNMALAAAGDALMVFMDDDVRVDAQTLCAYAEIASGKDGGELYGGPMGVDYQTPPPEWLQAYLPPSARGWRLEGGVQTYDKPGFVGTNWAAFAQDVREAGGFDEHFGFGTAAGGTGEETNLQERLLRRGIRGVYVPDAMVWHYVPAERCSPRWTLQRAYQQGIEIGLKHVTEARTLGGVSRWMVQTWLSKAMKVLGTAVRGDPQDSFGAHYRFRFSCGYIRGSRFARAKHPPPIQTFPRAGGKG